MAENKAKITGRAKKNTIQKIKRENVKICTAEYSGYFYLLTYMAAGG